MKFLLDLRLTTLYHSHLTNVTMTSHEQTEANYRVVRSSCLVWNVSSDNEKCSKAYRTLVIGCHTKLFSTGLTRFSRCHVRFIYVTLAEGSRMILSQSQYCFSTIATILIWRYWRILGTCTSGFVASELCSSANVSQDQPSTRTRLWHLILQSCLSQFITLNFSWLSPPWIDVHKAAVFVVRLCGRTDERLWATNRLCAAVS